MAYKKIKEKETTIRVKESTKKRLVGLKFVGKEMTYDKIINILIDKSKKKKR